MDGTFFVLQFISQIFTLALNSARKSKCFLRSVARIASMTRKRKRLNSTCSRLARKLYSGRDMKRFHAEAAWWFSKTERSLYRRAYSGRPTGESKFVRSWLSLLVFGLLVFTYTVVISNCFELWRIINSVFCCIFPLGCCIVFLVFQLAHIVYAARSRT